MKKVFIILFLICFLSNIALADTYYKYNSKGAKVAKYKTNNNVTKEYNTKGAYKYKYVNAGNKIKKYNSKGKLIETIKKD